MKINKKQYEALQPFEHYLDTAAHFNYVRTLAMSDARKIADVYKQVTKQTANLSCPSCVFSMCKTLGNLYFNYKNTITQDEQI